MSENPSSGKPGSYSLPVSISGSGTTNFNIKGEEYQVCVMRPSPSASVHELRISLDRNREMLWQSANAMHKLLPGKTVVEDLLSPTRNALVARANIDMLIPLINIKGGEAAYINKNEALHIEQHIEKLRDEAFARIANVTKKTSWDNPLILIMSVVVMTLIFLYLLLKYILN